MYLGLSVAHLRIAKVTRGFLAVRAAGRGGRERDVYRWILQALMHMHVFGRVQT